jgi:hypothetical protein
MKKNAVVFTSASEAVMRAAILIETLQLYARYHFASTLEESSAA